MATALTTRLDQPPATAIPPRLSGSLAYYVAGEVSTGGHVSPVVGSPSAADRAEAQRLLPQFEHMCRPPSEATIVLWVTPLAAAVANPPSQDDMPHRLSAIVAGCGDLPVSAFTAHTQRLAIGTFKFWPAVAELREFLSHQVGPLRRSLSGLRRVAAAEVPEKAAPRVGPTDQEKAVVSATVQALVAEQRSRETGGREAVTPRYLSRGGLLAEHERLAAQGNKASAIRAAALRLDMATGEP